jgi:hypothetical protein
MVSVAVELAARLPIVHAPVVLAYVPVEAFDEWNVSVEGNVSDATAPIAVDVPLFVTLMV